ncbi:hypothetical protein HMPREF0208_03164, partial [Citrobacter koseri]
LQSSLNRVCLPHNPALFILFLICLTPLLVAKLLLIAKKEEFP